MGIEADSFRPILERFGVKRDSALIVHSAIKRLSHAGFRAEAMIDAFLDHVRSGHLFMPTMTWRTVLPDNPRWDELGTPSHTGVLSETFRTRNAIARSIHPTHSVAGWGPDAKLLLSRHHIDDTPVSENSPYGLLRDYPTFVLMIGVGLETVTAIHLPEETIAEDLYVRPRDTSVTYECRDRHGTVHLVPARRHWRLDRDFPQFAAPLKAKGQLEDGEIAGCPWIIVRLSDLLRDVFAAMLRDPRGTLRRETAPATASGAT